MEEHSGKEPDQKTSSKKLSLKINYTDMTNEAIMKQVDAKINEDRMLNIHFKQRSTVTGLFIRTNDYNDLSKKNLWRIVNKIHIDEWEKTKDINLCRIFNGTEFTRLSKVNPDLS
jgi:hypothetical protein